MFGEAQSLGGGWRNALPPQSHGGSIMSIQPLTTTKLHGSLRFSNAANCQQWIDTLPLTNVQQVQQMLFEQLSALGAAEIAPIERLKILETLKETVAFVQGEAAKRYAGKPLPLENAEAAVWTNVIALWQELSRNYHHCLKAYREGDLAIAPHAALVTMRAIRHLGDVLFDHYRAYRQVPGAAWRSLHELYALAEQHGFARIRVADSFAQIDPDSSCAESYAQVLLTHLANPYSLSVRQITFVRRWLDKWAALIGLSNQPLPPSPIPQLVVDLGSSCGIAFEHERDPQGGLRYLDLEQLSKTLRQSINLLKQGQTPEQLGLGDDARQPGCENLMMLLYVQWCRAGTARAEDRLPVSETASVCFGIAAAHHQVNGGRAFRQPGELTSREKQDLDTYGFIVRVEHETGAGQGVSAETWQIVNHSASGFMCMLRTPDGSGRVSHNQLLAVRRQSGKEFHVGMVQWIRIEENNEMHCGVRLFPGVPRAISVRPSNFTPVGTSKYERALMLPELPAPATPATIILPAGWFQSGRFVEISSDRKQVAKLLNLLEKGNDFDRGTISIV